MKPDSSYLFIIGYPKCGTTSLFTYLNAHPDFCGASKKEPSYFRHKDFKVDNYCVDEYLRFFSHCASGKILMEASVSNVYGGAKLAEYLRKTFPRAKVVVLLREPAERLYSFYHTCKQNERIPPDMSFDAYLAEGARRVAAGEELERAAWLGYATQYPDHLFNWMDVFDDDIFIGFFEDLKADPAAFCDDICDWLGVARISEFTNAFPIENKTVSPRNARFHQLARAANRAAEPLLRRNIAVKRSFRRLYWVMNVDTAGPEKPTAAQATHLQTLFATPNLELREGLSARRPDLRLPAWLASADRGR